MIQESFTDAERKRMIRLAIDEMARLVDKDAELINIVAMLSGTDTVIVAQRAYAARRLS